MIADWMLMTRINQFRVLRFWSAQAGAEEHFPLSLSAYRSQLTVRTAS
jgi:hypothetical protein